MRKYIIGIVFGLLLSLPVAVHADDVRLMIGKAVEGSFPLIINEKKSEKDALVIDGTSYIPVRAAGELFGYDVSFIDSQIILNKKDRGVTEMDPATKERLDMWEQGKEERQKQSDNNQKQIDLLEQKIKDEQAAYEAERKKILDELAKDEIEYQKAREAERQQAELAK